MSDDMDPAGFYKRAERYLMTLAQERNLGLALGTYVHARLGPLRFIAVNGWIGQVYAILFVCETDARWMLGQARVWWYMNDWNEPFEFRIMGRQPMAERGINAETDLDDEIGSRMRWLEGLTSIDQAIIGIYGKALSGLKEAEGAAADVHAALASDPPKDDEEGPA